MSQTSAPLGLRLRTSVFWQRPSDLFSDGLVNQQIIYTHQWLLGFFLRNFMYLFKVNFLHQNRFAQYVSLVFYTSAMKRSYRRLRRLWVAKGSYSTRRNNTNAYKQRGLFKMRWRTKAGVLRGLVAAAFTQFIRRRFFPRVHVGGTSKAFKKRLVAADLQLARVTLGRLRLVRLKLFLEKQLHSLLARRTVCFLTNLNEVHLAKPGHNQRSLSRILQETRTAGGTSTAWLLVTTVLVGTPAPALTWLYYHLASVKKHSLNVSHQSYISTLTSTLKTLVYFSGLLQGYRLQVRGKLGSNPRAQTYIYSAGRSAQNQTLATKFGYHLIHIPTFSGSLGVRLWYLF